jgi:hypothetical protein
MYRSTLWSKGLRKGFEWGAGEAWKRGPPTAEAMRFYNCGFGQNATSTAATERISQMPCKRFLGPPERSK